jgi:SAM-dependent methyltransferase
MNPAIARRLLRLNREFYDSFALEFADSRSALQPGIARALRALGRFKSIVDVGCGDGRVRRALASGVVDHRVERYVGVDFSARLLAEAQRAGGNGVVTPPRPSQRYGIELVVAQATEVATTGYVWHDLAAPGWSTRVADPPFDAAVCFSVLHHIPGVRRRLRLLREVRSLLQPRGRCAISVWQFLHTPRLRRKIVPWREIGLRSSDVDKSDYLIDWRRGGRGLRYIHHFHEAELVAACRRAGFDVIETYRSDGQTGDLGLYILLEAVLY